MLSPPAVVIVVSAVIVAAVIAVIFFVIFIVAVVAVAVVNVVREKGGEGVNVYAAIQRSNSTHFTITTEGNAACIGPGDGVGG